MMKNIFIIILLLGLISCNTGEEVNYDYKVGNLKIELKLNENMVQVSGPELEEISKNEENFNKKVLLTTLYSGYRKEFQAIIIDTANIFPYVSIVLMPKTKITKITIQALNEIVTKKLESTYTVTEIENNFIDNNRDQFKLKLKLNSINDEFYLTCYIINTGQVAFIIAVGSDNEDDFEDSIKEIKTI